MELLRLLRDTPMERFWEMGNNGREHVLKNFTLDLFGAKYASLYENLMTNPNEIKQID